MTLGSAPAAGTYVDIASDGNGGTELFLSTDPNFHAQGTNDSWADPTSWGGSSAPSQTPAVGTGFTLVNYDNGPDDILMPATLQQATGSGASTWTISDTAASANPYTSGLTLNNLGSIFVNGSDNFTAGSATTNWTLAGAASGGADIFRNDGAVNVIGTSGGGSTQATFSGANLSITGDGEINVYGNAEVTFANGVGVSASQTVNFVSANGNTNGQVIEGGGVDDAAQIAGFQPGDTLQIQQLGGSDRPDGRRRQRGSHSRDFRRRDDRR